MDNRKWENDAIVSPPTAPASPSDGYPTNGDPGAAQNATEPGAWWFHAIGEELRAVIVEGGLTPNISTLTQLRDAIKNIARGGDYKASVRVASTAAINLAAPGASIDGVAMVAGDRFLEKDHATLASRGIYMWNGAAVPATRAEDADTGAEFNSGAIIPVEEGTVNANTNWQITNDGTVTIGVTDLTFQQVNMPADASETVKGIVELATDMEAQGFTANKFIDGAKLNSAFKGANQSLGANGYQKLPGGLIIQWGTLTNSATVNAPTGVVFPIAFPNANLTVANAIQTTNTGAYAWIDTPTNSGFNSRASIANALSKWFVIGC